MTNTDELSEFYRQIEGEITGLAVPEFGSSSGNFRENAFTRLVARTEKRRKDQIAGLPATYEVWDLERLRRLRESGTSYEALNVDFTAQPGGGLSAVRLDTGEGGFRTWVTVFPGSLLSELYG